MFFDFLPAFPLKLSEFLLFGLVLLAGLMSFTAPDVPVPATTVLVCRKLMEALTVLLAGTLMTPAGLNVTTPVAGL